MHMINTGIGHVHGEASLFAVYPADLIEIAVNPEGKAHPGEFVAFYRKMKLGISDIKGVADVIIPDRNPADNGIGRKRDIRRGCGGS